MPVSELDAAEAQAAAAGGEAKRAYVQRIFSQIAPRYDLLNHLLSFNVDRAWRRKAIAALGWERAPTGVYVDLCAGTLDVSAELARRPGFAGRVIAADFAEPMLRAGAGKAPAAVVSPVVADALDLPLADEARRARSSHSASGTSPISIAGCARCTACSRRARDS